jgi:hypothetical protein
LFDWMIHLVGGNPWTYAVVCGVAAGDVLFPLAAGVALLVGLAIEGYRRLQARRGRDVLGDPIGRAGSPRRR